MSMICCLSDNVALVDKFLPGLEKSFAWSLWVKPESRNFNVQEIAQLQKAFLPLRGIVWFGEPKSFVKRSEFTNQTIWPGQLISETVTKHSRTDSVALSQVAWLPDDPHLIVTDLMWKIHKNGGGTTSFIPNAVDVSEQWSNITQGLNWLWLCNQWVAAAPIPLIDADSTALSYLKLTQEIQGIPSLMWVDSDLNTGLTFFGRKEALELPLSHLHNIQESNVIIDNDYISKLSRRGFYFNLCK